jgi:TRAP-type C4-dicarboxylate transport system permease large subunit
MKSKVTIVIIQASIEGWILSKAITDVEQSLTGTFYSLSEHRSTSIIVGNLLATVQVSISSR